MFAARGRNYICANFSKPEDEMSEAMKEAAKETSVLRKVRL